MYSDKIDRKDSVSFVGSGRVVERILRVKWKRKILPAPRRFYVDALERDAKEREKKEAVSNDRWDSNKREKTGLPFAFAFSETT
jgi:hypothetical protein